MKTLKDVLRMAELEAQHANNRYLKTKERPYLWYAPTTKERNGGILSAVERPSAEYQPITGEPVRMNMPVKTYVASISSILSKLPILSN